MAGEQTIFVSGIPDSLSSEGNVQDYFAQFGEVVHVAFEDVDSAFVTFSPETNIERLLEEKHVMEENPLAVTLIESPKRRKVDEGDADEAQKGADDEGDIEGGAHDEGQGPEGEWPP
eukprot:CAMPEP_0115462256 /NCGR_PEP_ID=MMETSP0271-20121206/47726_1 /TAXON_ID=71861 /ORGANISM="Scrippsiella trochoidea, Strain CCMP3099" /LENGTH=116 /DNA_ID=CAMNT_0002889029 /DNA_START=46 /DNA_END=392 /DNA_ORIENTATION=+